MNALFNKPNLLFLIFVRNQNRGLLLSKLRRPIYRIKLIKALTTVVKDDGTQSWYINGKLHREDGPAIIWGNCTQDGNLRPIAGRHDWYKEGKLHRDNGPAIIWADGSQYWYKNGHRHRDDGPAIIWHNGYEEWWENDKYKTSNDKYKTSNDKYKAPNDKYKAPNDKYKASVI